MTGRPQHFLPFPHASSKWAAVISHALVSSLLASLVACGGGGGGGNSSSTNTAPQAVVLPVGVVEVGDTAVLNGSNSTDSEGATLHFTWTLTSAPAESKSVLIAPNSANARLVPDHAGIYVATLVVNDGKLDSAPVQLSITANHRPVVHYTFGVPLIPGEYMQIDASGSSDADGDVLTYKWTIVSTPPGATASFSDASSAKPELQTQQAGEYQLGLEVSDGKATTSAGLTVTVDNLPVGRISGASTSTIGSEVTLDGSGSSDPDGDPLTFVWSFSMLPNGSQTKLSSTSGSQIRFTPDTGGIYDVNLIVYDKLTSSRSSTVHRLTVNTPPVAQISAPTSAILNSTVTLDGSKSSDAENSPLSYAWRLTSMPAGSTARLDSATAKQPKFTPDVIGSYTVSLIVNDGTSDSAPASSSIAVEWSGTFPSTPVVKMTPQPALASQEIEFNASAIDPNGLALSYLWQFDDGTTSLGSRVLHRFSSAGSHNVNVVATNSKGLSSNVTTVKARVVGQVLSSLTPSCSGSNCGASSANYYAGSGTGIWSYTNSGSEDLAFNIDIDNVSSDRSITLLITNGSASSASSLPDFGQAIVSGSSASGTLRRARAITSTKERAALSSTLAQRDTAHQKMLQRNTQALRSYLSSSLPRRTATSAKPSMVSRLSVAPTLHSSRTWRGGMDEPNYDTSAEAICTLPDGRNAVFWVDTTALASGLVSSSTASEFANFYCGNSGAYAQLTALTGSVWGNSNDSTLISDDTLQDVNIVLGDPKSTTYWGGYFSFSNSFRKSVVADSNEALVFFLNMRFLKGDRNYLLSSLVHESMHMVNAYQRTVRLGVSHESWLEETTAMMSEDIVIPALLKDGSGQPFDYMGTGRLPYFIFTGGSASYTADPSGATMYTYAEGGTFGAFLNRRYGTALFKRLLTSCGDYTANQSSYACVDSAIKYFNGTSMAAELAQMRAGVMSWLTPAQSPSGYGFPQRLEGSYLMPTLDPSGYPGFRQDHSPALTSTFPATTLVYISDAVPTGSSRYRRSGVILPTGSTLELVIR